jgi:hypothetical protein
MTTLLGILAILVGVLGGLSAIIFRQLIHLVFVLFYELPSSFGIPFSFLLPVVTKDKFLKGWITRSDAIKYYLKQRHLEQQDKFERELFDNPFVLELLKRSDAKD